MHTNSVEFQTYAVEQKTFVRAEPCSSEAEFCLNIVILCSVLAAELYRQRIKIRRNSIPQLRTVCIEHQFVAFSAHSALTAVGFTSYRIDHIKRKRSAGLHRQLCLYSHFPLALLSAVAVVGSCAYIYSVLYDMITRGLSQPYVAVYAGAAVPTGIWRLVIYSYQDAVVTLDKAVCYVKAE